MPGLGASFGRGAATTYLQDLANSDCVLIMGSNMAEAHPVGFRWPLKAREKGAKLIHVDPRFTRTSAMMDTHVQIRAGSDIAFLGGLIHYVLEHERWFPEYVLAYTNASVLVDPEFLDSEDAGGLFSGYDVDEHDYDPKKGHWSYKKPPGAEPPDEEAQSESSGHAVEGGASTHNTPQGGPDPAAQARDETLQNPHCVMQMLKRHFSRYDPQTVADICGCTPEQITTVAGAPVPEFGSGAHLRHLLRSRLDPTFHRCANHPGGGHLADVAGKYGSPGRRHHGFARPREHPGIHRHPYTV